MVHPRARGRQGRTGNNNVSSGNKSGVVNGTRGNTSKTTTDQPVFTSLSDRFQQISQQRATLSTPRRGTVMKAQSSKGLKLSAQAQAQLVKQAESSNTDKASSRQRSSHRGRGSGRGGRGSGGRGGRGGRGGHRRPLTREALDRELDDYLMKDAERARAKLDEDLDAYMMDVQMENANNATETAPTTAATGSTTV